MTKNAGRCQLRQGWTGFTAGAVLVLACAGCTVQQVTDLLHVPAIVAPAQKATAATYVYEKDQGSVPSGVQNGLDRLNRETAIVATALEDDAANGLGSVPKQYRVAVDEARKAGEPLLVVTAGDTVLARVSAPTTADEVWRAAQ